MTFNNGNAMDFNTLSEDEAKLLAAIAFPALPQTPGLSSRRESICQSLVEKGFLDRLNTPPGLPSYRMQIGVHLGFCQWCCENAGLAAEGGSFEASPA